MRARILAVVVFGTAMVFQPAQAEFHNFSVCNKLDSTELRIAIVTLHHPFWSDEWNSWGWRAVMPGKCQRVFGAEDIDEVYLSIRYIGQHKLGPKIGYPLLPITNSPENFFCIGKDGQGYDRKSKKSKRDIQACSSGWGELQLFNAHFEFENSQSIDYIIDESGVSLSRRRSVRY